MIGKHNTGGFQISREQAFPRIQGELDVPRFKKDDQVEIVNPDHEYRGRVGEVVSADTTEENPGHDVAYLVQFFGTTLQIWFDERDLKLIPDKDRPKKNELLEAIRATGIRADEAVDNLRDALREEFRREDRPAELKKDRIGDPLTHARNLVWGIFYGENVPIDDVYVVWFCASLQNWKALISTNVKDNCYYEVIHNGDKNETYVDKYVKHQNVCVDENINRYI